MKIVKNFSIEALPRTATLEMDLHEILPPGTRIYIAHVAGTSINDMVSTAERIRAQGFPVMPHVPARMIDSLSTFQAWLGRYREAGVDEALVIAGGVANPAGRFSSAMELLETGLFDRYGFTRLHVAGHPEGSRDIDPDGGTQTVDEAVRWKDRFSKERTDCDMALVTQFGFDPARVIAWAERLQDMGITLPVHVGVAGPAKLRTLLRFALSCGVGPSLSVLRKRARDLSKLLQAYTPDEFVIALDAYKRIRPNSNIEQIHLFPFGGITASARWAAEAKRSIGGEIAGEQTQGKQAVA